MGGMRLDGSFPPPPFSPSGSLKPPPLGKGKKGEASPSDSLGGSKGNTLRVSSTSLFKETASSLSDPSLAFSYIQASGGG